MATALTLENVCIDYRILNNTSVQKSLFKKKKHAEVFEAVKNISFEMEEGGILGIIGKNGSGKSTLLKSIAGVFTPNSGKIDLHGHTVSLMALGVGFKDLLSGRENIILSGMLLGFSEEEIKSRIEEIIEFAELGDFIDKPVRTYSSGMHSKLAFAITAMLETDIMLVDEVLSVGDERFRKKSLAKMKSLIADRDRTVVIVSHSIETLREFCDEVLWIHEGETIEFGKTNTVLEHYLEYMETQKSSVLEKRKAESAALRVKEEAKKQANLDNSMTEKEIQERIRGVRNWYNLQLASLKQLEDDSLRMRELFRIMDIFVDDYAGFTRNGDAAFSKYIDSFCQRYDYMNKIDTVSLFQDFEDKFAENASLSYMSEGKVYTIEDMLNKFDEHKIGKLVDKKTLESYRVKSILYRFKNRMKRQVDIPGSILAYELEVNENGGAISKMVPYYSEYRILVADIENYDNANSEMTTLKKEVVRRSLFFPVDYVETLVIDTVGNYLDYCEKELICPFKKMTIVQG